MLKILRGPLFQKNLNKVLKNEKGNTPLLLMFWYIDLC